MSWSKVKLSDVCDLQIGKTPSRSNEDYWGEGIKWVSIADMTSKYLTDTKEQITEKAITECGCKIIPTDTLLMSFKLSIGKLSFTTEKVITNEAIVALQIKDEHLLLKDYLYYALKKVNFTKNTDRAVKGLTLNKDKLSNIRLQLPPYDIQQKIASALTEADTLIEKRREAIAKLDKLLQSMFVEMFGDPILNTKKWNIEKLENVAELSRGRFSPRPRNDPSYYNGDYPFIQTGDISKSQHRLRKWSQTLNERGIVVSKLFPKGTVVIAIVGATIGATAILEIDCYAPDSIIGITPNNQIATSEYIEFVLRYWKPIFLSLAPDTARANINLETLKPIHIPLPPIDKQIEFTSLCNEIEFQKKVMQQQLEKLEENFQTLLHQAFTEQLQFSIEGEKIADKR